MNLIEGLQQELERNRELLQIYRGIPSGQFGAVMIERAIKNAETAMAENDVVKMMTSYKELKETE